MEHLKPSHGASCGLLFVGHGTRDAAGLAEFAELARRVEQLLPRFKLQTAFLELAKPDIPTGIDRLLDQGVHHILVVPVLLFAAGHAHRDIPLAIQQAAVRYPQARFPYARPLECHPKVISLSEQRFREATISARFNACDVTLLLVGRGSLHDAATAAMHEYASLLANRVAVRGYRVAFMAMATPSFSSVLNQIVTTASGPIVIQPHLLFQGDLLRDLRAKVASVARDHPNVAIQVAKHLGADSLLAESLAELVERTCDERSLDKEVPLG